MAGTFINHTLVAREAVRQLKNHCVMGNLVFRGYEEEWKKNPNGWKIGNSITLKAPVYFRVKNGAVIDVVNVVERSTTFTLSYRKHVAWPITSQEMTLNIDKFSKRFITPAMQALGNYIDETLLSLYKGIPNQVGTPGTTPNKFYTFAEASAVLSDEGCPQQDRSVVMDPWAQASMADNLKGLFQAQIVGQVIGQGSVPQLATFTPYMSQNVQTHTNGTWASGITVQKDGASSEGDTTLAIKSDGTTNTALQGDIFTIATVNSNNPISGASTGRLRQFVVDANATMDGSGEIAALQATPGTAPHNIYSASASEDYLPYQTVVALPANNDAVTIAGTTGQTYKANLAFHKDCLGLCMVPLEIPASASWSAQESYEGYTIRVIRDYDVTNDQEYIRFDVLFGVKVLNPFLGCRIAGA